jgi:hypothetical protein
VRGIAALRQLLADSLWVVICLAFAATGSVNRDPEAARGLTRHHLFGDDCRGAAVFALARAFLAG